jgi:hypothetical protein
MTAQPGAVRTIVTAAITILLVLGGLLGARLVLRWWQSSRLLVPPNSRVEAPLGTAVSGLDVPCWSCPSAKEWPVRFQTDLDLIAPLGSGAGNAAEFFALFEKGRGPRDADAQAFQKRRYQRDDDLGEVVAGDDELLLEAEPWVDQATMRFYPEIFRMEGADTRITNLLLMLTMARSWTGRGVDADDPDLGLEDCRRAIRLGRLLRQEDVVIINDLVGLACIHIGTRGMYRIAQREGDTELALLASIVLGEVAPQRLMTATRISTVDLAPYLRRAPSGTFRLDLPDSHLDSIMEMAEDLSERRFFGEIILTGSVIAQLGTPEQQARVLGLLEEIETDEDPIIADFARWALDNPPTNEKLAEYYPHPMER